jgi:hypothetical protein
MPVLEAVTGRAAAEVVRIALQQSAFGDNLKAKVGLDPLQRAF